MELKAVNIYRIVHKGIVALVVFDETTKREMAQLVEKNKLTCAVHVNPNSAFYY